MPTRLVSRLPLSVKLPLVMGGLMLAILTVTSIVAVMELRKLAMASAGARLNDVSKQIGTMLEGQVRVLATSADSMADQPAIEAWFRSPGNATRENALRVLAYRGRVPEQVITTELWDIEGRPVLQDSNHQRLPVVDRAAMARLAAGHATVGWFAVMNDTLILPVIAPVSDGSGLLGYYAQWRLLGGSAAGRLAMSRLVGSNAVILLGSTAGGAWTDLEKAVPAPPSVPSESSIATYERDDSARVAEAALVAGSPWAVVVDFPRDLVMQPVSAVIRRRIVIIAGSLLLTIALAWIAGRTLTRPLRLLTERAERMAETGYTTNIGLDREDEMGRLARAFDHAAERVREDQQRLENRVRERTVELHDAMEQLRSAQDMLLRKERLAILGQLSSGVGHELRNPLGVMTNAVYYLDAVAGSTSPKVKEYLGILRTQISLSERIVSDLLDFARVKQPQRQSVSLAELADAQLGRAGDLAGVRVQKEFPANLPRAFVDPMQMGQVVLNLLVNAVQAMGTAGGELRLRGSANGDGRLRLEVQDTGPGIEPELIDKIFEPLYTTKARGIGLGLAVSQSLATNNGAQLTVVSTPGQGATFVLSLPVASSGVAS